MSQSQQLLPVTTSDANSEAAQHSRFSMLTGVAATIKENAQNAVKEAKPWGELIDRSTFSKPGNMTEATSRLRQNANYFRTNYSILAAGTTALVMFMNPFSIIVLAFLAAAWFYMYIIKTSPLVIGSREFSEREKFMLMAGSSLVIIFFLTSVGSILFYALGLSMLIICAHAMMHQPDDLFIDEVPASANSGGLFSFFRGSNQNANMFGSHPIPAS